MKRLFYTTKKIYERYKKQYRLSGLYLYWKLLQQTYYDIYKNDRFEVTDKFHDRRSSSFGMYEPFSRYNTGGGYAKKELRFYIRNEFAPLWFNNGRYILHYEGNRDQFRFRFLANLKKKFLERKDIHVYKLEQIKFKKYWTVGSTWRAKQHKFRWLSKRKAKDNQKVRLHIKEWRFEL